MRSNRFFSFNLQSYKKNFKQADERLVLFFRVYEFLLNEEKTSLFHLLSFIFFCTFANVIQIERHIEILLLSNDCVIVPDFGGFMAHHIEAHYEEDESLFLPPLRTLGFNPQLRLNDSLLAQSYIEAYDISYPEALRRIAGEVSELKQHLNENGSYELNDLGTIYLNDDGNYEFTPCEAGILTPSLYALSSFEMQPLARQTATVVPLTEQLQQEEQTEAKEAEDERPSAATISIKVSTLRNIAAACIAVLVLWLFPSQFSNDAHQSAQQLQASSEIMQHMMPKNVTTGKPKAVVPQPAKTVQSAPIAKEKEEAPVVEDYFTIVLASQVSKKNADYYVEQLHKDGFSLAEVLLAGKNTRVIYGHFASESEAYNALRPLRSKSSEFAEGWVMKVKP